MMLHHSTSSKFRWCRAAHQHRNSFTCRAPLEALGFVAQGMEVLLPWGKPMYSSQKCPNLEQTTVGTPTSMRPSLRKNTKTSSKNPPSMRAAQVCYTRPIDLSGSFCQRLFLPIEKPPPIMGLVDGGTLKRLRSTNMFNCEFTCIVGGRATKKGILRNWKNQVHVHRRGSDPFWGGNHNQRIF